MCGVERPHESAWLSLKFCTNRRRFTGETVQHKSARLVIADHKVVSMVAEKKFRALRTRANRVLSEVNYFFCTLVSPEFSDSTISRAPDVSGLLTDELPTQSCNGTRGPFFSPLLQQVKYLTSSTNTVPQLVITRAHCRAQLTDSQNVKHHKHQG